ncbi:endonuclease III [bacterium]|nr:endonuclease III [bacterium]
MIKELKKLYPDWHTELIFKKPYEFLFAVIMSAQTTDKQVNEVTKNLFKKYKCLNDYIKASPVEFEKDLSKIGLYKNKAKNILLTAKILNDKFNGAIPKTIEDLTSLPGVGRKTANLVLAELFNIADGITVDTHVARLAWRFDLTDSKNDPVKIEKDLMEILPKKDWLEFNGRLVLYGRYLCPARKHDCLSHPLTKVWPEANNRWYIK